MIHITNLWEQNISIKWQIDVSTSSLKTTTIPTLKTSQSKRWKSLNCNIMPCNQILILAWDIILFLCLLAYNRVEATDFSHRTPTTEENRIRICSNLHQNVIFEEERKCACVCERERERERKRKSEINK